MSAAYQSLKNSWLFRSKANFMLFFFGFTSTGYFIARYHTEQKFQHPVIKETCRILEKNQQILELIGYPISVQSTVRSTAIINDNDCNFMFIAKGPKGYISIDMSGSALIHKYIDEQKKQEFYIPDPTTYSLLADKEDQNANLEKEVLPPDSKFWKINYLYADLGGQYRIVLLPQKEQQQQMNQTTLQEKVKTENIPPNQNENITQRIPYFKVTQRQNLQDLRIEEQRRKGLQDNQPKSEEEMEEIRKFKMQELYRKIGYIRFYMACVFIFGGMTIYVYVMKNRRKNIVGSQIHFNTQLIIKRNEVAKQLFGQQLKFSQSVRGSQVGNDADFEMDIFGDKALGIAKVKGKYDEKNSQWNIEKIDLEVKDKNGNIKKTQKIK